jgi:Putative zinc-finger
MSEHTQVASYALGLLEPAEMAQFEAHLAECDACAEQLEWMLPVSGALADVEPGDLFGVTGPSALRPPSGARPFTTADDAPYPGSTPLRPVPSFPTPPTGPVPPAPPEYPEYPEYPSVPLAPAAGPAPTTTPPPVDRPGNRPIRAIPIERGERGGTLDPMSPDARRADPLTGEIPIDPARDPRRPVPRVRAEDGRRRPPSLRPAGRGFAGSPGLLLASAAAVIGVIAGAGAVTLLPGSDPGPGTSTGTAVGKTADRVAATDDRTGVHADVALESKAWGTLVSFAVSDVAGPRECRLVAETADGKSEVLSSWTVPEQGYGQASKLKELRLQASTSLPRKDITALRIEDVRRSGSTPLVTLQT